MEIANGTYKLKHATQKTNFKIWCIEKSLKIKIPSAPGPAPPLPRGLRHLPTQLRNMFPLLAPCVIKKSTSESFQADVYIDTYTYVRMHMNLYITKYTHLFNLRDRYQ